jgi:hypothetical protein
MLLIGLPIKLGLCSLFSNLCGPGAWVRVLFKGGDNKYGHCHNYATDPPFVCTNRTPVSLCLSRLPQNEKAAGVISPLSVTFH